MKKLIFTVLFFAHIQTIKTIDDGNINQSKNENSVQINEKAFQEPNTGIVKIIEKPSAHKTSNHEFKIIKKLALAITLFTLSSINQFLNTAESIKEQDSYLERHLLFNSLYDSINWVIFINCISASAFIVSIFDDFVQSF